MEKKDYLDINVIFNRTPLVPTQCIKEPYGTYKLDVYYHQKTSTVYLTDKEGTYPFYFLAGDPKTCDKFAIACFMLVHCNGKYLLIRRGKDMKVFPKKIAFPGGFIKPEESIIDCAKRELDEETELKLPSNCTINFNVYIFCRL